MENCWRLNCSGAGCGPGVCVRTRCAAQRGPIGSERNIEKFITAKSLRNRKPCHCSSCRQKRQRALAAHSKPGFAQQLVRRSAHLKLIWLSNAMITGRPIPSQNAAQRGLLYASSARSFFHIFISKWIATPAGLLHYSITLSKKVYQIIPWFKDLHFAFLSFNPNFFARGQSQDQ